MERVSGLDAGFLALETPTMHMHIAAVMVFEPPAGDGDLAPAAMQFERLRRVVEERMHLVPALRRRVVRVPFGLHHPVWVEDPEFDLDYHLRRAHLPAPGGPGELHGFVADLAGRPLDQERPLWEMHLVEGLDSGHVAVVVKLHHAIIDGASGAEILAAFLDLGPVPRSVAAPSRPWRPDPVPSEAEMLAWAASSMARQPERALSAVRRTFGVARELAGRNRRLREEDEQHPPPAPFSAPRSSLNGAISPHRRFAVAEASLEDVRVIREALGGTVNDVVLAAVSGALRLLLAERGEEVADPMVAMVPISARGAEPASVGESTNAANRVSAMLVSLASSLPDSAERLRVIAEGTRVAKAQARLLPEDLFQSWAQLAFPALSSRVAKLSGNMRLFDRLPPLFNVVVSNIAGPEVPLWCAGGRLVALYPIGPIVEGVGLNITVVSYDDTLYFGVLGCRDLVPEVDHVTGHISDAMGELVKAAARDRHQRP